MIKVAGTPEDQSFSRNSQRIRLLFHLLENVCPGRLSGKRTRVVLRGGYGGSIMLLPDINTLAEEMPEVEYVATASPNYSPAVSKMKQNPEMKPIIIPLPDHIKLYSSR